eukprot:2692417-Lingulodinium_polyedra.AAC.1
MLAAVSAGRSCFHLSLEPWITPSHSCYLDLACVQAPCIVAEMPMLYALRSSICVLQNPVSAPAVLASREEQGTPHSCGCTAR